MKFSFKDPSREIHVLSILNHGRCLICNHKFDEGEKYYSGVSNDGTSIIACEKCKTEIKALFKEYVFYEKEFLVPDLNIKLWRYQDFAKFVSLLESKKLYFPRADSFDDPFEGARGFNFQKDAIYYRTKEYLRLSIHSECLSKRIILSDNELENKISSKLDEIIIEQENKRKRYYISCWHENDRESEGMWKLYTTALNQGVAIQTTMERLCSSLDDDSFEIGNVKYISFDEPLDDDKIPIWYKRDAFAHEREVRVVICNPTSVSSGLLVNVDLDTLIERIYVSPAAPKWLAELVESVIKTYSIDKPVEYSQLNNTPIY